MMTQMKPGLMKSVAEKLKLNLGRLKPYPVKNFTKQFVSDSDKKLDI